jgi:hypothetical protein
MRKHDARGLDSIKSPAAAKRYDARILVRTPEEGKRNLGVRWQAQRDTALDLTFTQGVLFRTDDLSPRGFSLELMIQSGVALASLLDLTFTQGFS